MDDLEGEVVGEKLHECAGLPLGVGFLQNGIVVGVDKVEFAVLGLDFPFVIVRRIKTNKCSINNLGTYLFIKMRTS